MFNYKVYNLSWTYKFTINIKDIKNLISFTANENWGQWQCKLLLNYNFETTTIVNTDIIHIYKDTTLIYTWIVQDVFRKINNNFEEIELPLLWLWTLPTYLLYKDSWNYVFSKNQDPSQTIKDIIDYINTIYTAGWLSYDVWSIETYWTTVDIDFDYDNCLEALIKCIETTNFKFFIDRDWKVYFKSKPVSATHTLTVWKDIEQINLEEDSENLINKLLLEYKSWILPYEDIASQGNYWLKEKYLSKTDLIDIASADEFWNNYIELYKNPINKTSIILNKNFNLENIKVWDTIKVKNFNYIINNLQIVKYSYTIDKIKLELEIFDSFGKEFIT